MPDGESATSHSYSINRDILSEWSGIDIAGIVPKPTEPPIEGDPFKLEDLSESVRSPVLGPKEANPIDTNPQLKRLAENAKAVTSQLPANLQPKGIKLPMVYHDLINDKLVFPELGESIEASSLEVHYFHQLLQNNRKINLGAFLSQDEVTGRKVIQLPLPSSDTPRFDPFAPPSISRLSDRNKPKSTTGLELIIGSQKSLLPLDLQNSEFQKHKEAMDRANYLYSRMWGAGAGNEEALKRIIIERSTKILE